MEISFLNFSNSFSNFLYIFSKKNLSLRNLSISFLKFLSYSIASLNFWFALSSRFSKIRICFSYLSFNAWVALRPPISFFITRNSFWISAILSSKLFFSSISFFIWIFRSWIWGVSDWSKSPFKCCFSSNFFFSRINLAIFSLNNSIVFLSFFIWPWSCLLIFLCCCIWFLINIWVSWIVFLMFSSFSNSDILFVIF